MRVQIPTGPSFVCLLLFGVFCVFLGVCIWVVLSDLGLCALSVASLLVLGSLVLSDPVCVTKHIRGRRSLVSLQNRA